MTKQKQMTEKELDQVSGGGVWAKLDGLSRRRGFHAGSVAQGTLFLGYTEEKSPV